MIKSIKQKNKDLVKNYNDQCDLMNEFDGKKNFHRKKRRFKKRAH